MTVLDTPTLLDFAFLARYMREDEKAQWCAMTGFAEYDAELCARSLATTQGLAWCLRDATSKPLAVAGFEPIRSGVYQAWMAGTPEAWASHWRTITKVCRRMADSLLGDGTARRIQILALESRAAALTWYARGLGHRFEGIHRAFYADGQNAACYARTRADWEADRG